MKKIETVRDSKRVSPYCSGCGCRLETTPSGTDNYIVQHFPGSRWETDARGCSCIYIASTWILSEQEVYI